MCKELLDGRIHRAAVNSSVFRWKSVISGVLQGSIFQPGQFKTLTNYRDWDLAHPQKICRWHQAKWCCWQTWRMGSRGQAEGSHVVQQSQVQGAVSGSGQPLVSWLRGWTDQEQPCWEELGAAGGWNTGHEQPNCTCSPLASHIVGCIQSSTGNKSRELILPPCSTLVWPHLEYATSSRTPNIIRRWTSWSRSREWLWTRLEGWNPSPMRKGWEAWGCSSWRKDSEETLLWQ